MSSVWSSKTSDSVDSGERRSPLIKVPLDDLTSLIKTCRTCVSPSTSAWRRVTGARLTFPSSDQTSACARLSTLLSKYPLVAFGTVLALICLPILTRPPPPPLVVWSSEICFGTKVPLSGVRCNAG